MDFLTFKSFISTEVLITFYYMGAIMMPIAMWIFSTWLVRRYSIFGETYAKGKKVLWSTLSRSQKVKLVLCFTACFFFMELFWRISFEFLIAYMQIRDALVLT